jgi:nucleoside-diphosphate-sugar epimerase
MRVLVTGANGFFGKNFQDYIQQTKPEGYEFVFVDKAEGDLLDLSVARRLVAGCDIVVHAAGIVGTGKFYNERGPEIYHKITTMDWNVFAACQEHSVKKVIYIGSGAAYSPDAIKNGVLKEEDFFYGMPDEYTLGYGMAKRNAYISMKLMKLPGVYLALSTMFGKYQDMGTDTGSFISATLGKFLRNENPICIGGTGKPVRDFISISNVVWVVMKFIQDYPLSNHLELYNVGGPGPISITEAVNIMSELFEYKGTVQYDTTKPNGQIMRVLDNGKLSRKFSECCSCYSPQLLFKEAIKEVINEKN